jgi:hypothetical protein
MLVCVDSRAGTAGARPVRRPHAAEMIHSEPQQGSSETTALRARPESAVNQTEALVLARSKPHSASLDSRRR